MKTVLTLCAAALAAFAQAGGQPHGDAPYLLEDGWKPLLSGRDMKGWVAEKGKPSEWLATKAISWDPVQTPKALSPAGGPGHRILNGPKGNTANIHTAEKFGDMELYLEFMVPQGSNSGVYLQGLYEVQVFDSYGKAAVTTTDAGAIYHRWINEKPVGGSAPKVNAARRPGEWQSYQIWFRAPRFDASGKKTENARFLRVLHNGLLVQENVEVDGGTRAHMDIPEAATNPLMLQGDHGPVAYRNIYWRPLWPLTAR
ncbi:MAG TPA: DUF1080 domain-containing protein [Solibacterales bacterium]|nr:DUF1080 domain-containing protein [Bryobacterales bacterium]